MKKILFFLIILSSVSYGQFLFPEIKSVTADTAAVLRTYSQTIARDTANSLRSNLIVEDLNVSSSFLIGGTTLEYNIAPQISDSISVVDSWWDILWSNSVIADSTTDLDIKPWSDTKHRIRVGTASRDTIMSIALYKRSDMDSIEFRFRYWMENADSGSTIYYKISSVDSAYYVASATPVTGRFCTSITGIANETMYDFLISVLPRSADTDIYIYPINIAILREK